MKVHNTYSAPTISAMDSSDFGMQASGKMFKMIISGLYSDKPQSITREIWSNAFDAHAMFGLKDVPFEVSLPSRWDPEFVVRDFGPGLSHEWMKQKYTIVGLSGKEETNDAVGKWGVGRMSPLSYIDTFSVTSIHKGMKAVYNVTMEQDGAPKLNTLVPPMETDEPNGFRVSFPVKPEDHAAFQAAAKRVSLGFDVRPKVTGDPDYEWPMFEYKVKGDGYWTYETDHSTGIKGVVAQMGCVIYPINLDLLALDHTDKNVFRSMSIVLNVPIGGVEVTASREDLSYGPKEPTKDTLTKLLKHVRSQLVKDTQTAVDACENDYKAYHLLSNANLPYQLKNLVTYKGNAVKNWSAPESFTVMNRDYSRRISSETVWKSATFEVKGIIIGNKGGPDADKRLDTRVRQFIRSGSPRDIYVVIYREWDKDKKTYDDSLEKVLVPYFGKDLVKMVSDLPDAVIAPRKVSKAKVYDFDWNEVEVDMEDGGVYVRSYSGNVEGLQWTRSYGILNCCEGHTNKVIANKSLWKKFENHPKWKDVTKEIKEEITRRNPEFKREVAKGHVYDRLYLREFISDFGPMVKSYYDTLDSVKIHPARDAFNAILRSQHIYSSDEPDEQKLMDSLREQFYERYPLMKHFRKEELEVFKDYVKGQDLLSRQ